MNMMHKQLFQIRMILPWMALCVIGAMVTTQKVSATPMVNQPKTPSNRLLTPVQNVQIGITAMDSIRISWDVSNQSSANVVTIKKRVDDGPFYVVGTTNAQEFLDDDIQDGRMYHYIVSTGNSPTDAIESESHRIGLLQIDHDNIWMVKDNASVHGTPLRTYLGKPTGRLTTHDVAHISTLYIAGYRTQDDVSTDSINGPLAAFTGLKKLEIHADGIQLHALSSLTKLKQLIALGIYSNDLVDITALEGLTQLTWLSLAGNNISNIEPIKHLRSLRTLNLAKNDRIKDIQPLAHLTSLKHLNLSRNNIADIASLASLNRLRVLNLSSNQINDVQALKHLTQLERLHLSYNQIYSIQPLAQLQHIEFFAAEHNAIHSIDAIRGWSQLQVLFLNNNRIESIEALATLPSITYASLNHNLIRDISVLQTMKAKSNMKIIMSKNPVKLHMVSNQVEDQLVVKPRHQQSPTK